LNPGPLAPKADALPVTAPPSQLKISIEAIKASYLTIPTQWVET